MLARPKKIPTSAGVYIFRKSAAPLYVGKAANLKSRLGSYFTKAEGRTPKVERMLKEATRLEIIEMPSEIEALIREAELIKKWRPKYNLLMRDDKSYFYVGITREPYPRIFVTHEPAKSTKLKARERNAKFIGPFTGGSELYAALKHLRRVFPYCTCKTLHKRPCLASEIGRCPGYCCTVVASSRQLPATSKHRSEYRKNIQRIIAVLSGERTRLTGRLKRDMRGAVRRERYEEAAYLRDALSGLESVFAHRSMLRAPEARLPDLPDRQAGGQVRHSWLDIEVKLKLLLGTRTGIERIEGYDISNILGQEATGSMVVFKAGRPDKSQYRKFRIKTVSGANDANMLREVLRRRLNRPEWPYPQLIVVDGGKPQLGAGLLALREYRIHDPGSGRPTVTALAKREEILHTESGRAIPLQRQDPAILHLFQRIRDESHRFARAYHHKLREKSYAAAR